MKRILSLAIVMIGLCTFSMSAQTATKKTTPKKTTTAKTGTKTGTKTAKKKPAGKKAGTVYICDGVNGYTYHSRRTCADLAKCKGRVLDMTKQEAINNYGRKECKTCH